MTVVVRSGSPVTVRVGNPAAESVVAGYVGTGGALDAGLDARIGSQIATDGTAANNAVDALIAAGGGGGGVIEQNIVFDGDSHTSTAYNPTSLAISDLAMEGVPNANVYNFGVAGQMVTAMTADATSQIDPLYDGAMNNVVVCWGGTNDLASVDGATTYSRIAAYCSARQAAGWKVIVVTVIPRGDETANPGLEAQRDACNDLMRANWATFADALVDTDTDAVLGLADITRKPWWYANATATAGGSHLTTDGRMRVAKMIRAALADVDVPMPVDDKRRYAARSDSFFVPASAFTPSGNVTTNPVPAAFPRSAWTFDPATSTGDLVATVQFPLDWMTNPRTFNARVIWAPNDATAGNVYWYTYLLPLTYNAAISAVAGQQGALGAAPGSANMFTATPAGGTFLSTVLADCLAMQVTMRRIGADASDTYAGTAHFVGIMFTR